MTNFTGDKQTFTALIQNCYSKRNIEDLLKDLYISNLT
jgi:hypothetical protein